MPDIKFLFTEKIAITYLHYDRHSASSLLSHNAGRNLCSYIQRDLKDRSLLTGSINSIIIITIREEYQTDYEQTHQMFGV